jgi:peptide/nickel transport system permease protein
MSRAVEKTPASTDASLYARGATASRRRINPRLALGGGLVAALVAIAVLAPWIAPYDPIAIDTKSLLDPPSWGHPMGTDNLGRDVLSRVVWGARVSLSVGLISVVVGTLGGVSIGLFSGYFGGWVDTIAMRFVDALLAFPPLLLALSITAALGPQIQNAMIAIGILAIPTYARITRGQVLSIRHRDYILAARAIGVPPARLLVRHVLPNIVNAIVVTATIWTGFAILTEAGLSFLGLGSQPPSPSWGQDLAYSQRQLFHGAWWTVAGPGFLILVAVFAFNVLGDGFRDALDPRLRRLRS